jgi:hypothetical protein
MTPTGGGGICGGAPWGGRWQAINAIEQTKRSGNFIVDWLVN